MLFAVMALLARLVSARIPGPQVALVRFALGVVVVAGLAAGGRVSLRPARWGWLFTRGAFGGLAVLTYFWCIEKQGVGLATLLNYTSPAWCLLFSWLLLRERPRPGAISALGLTLVGVALIVGADVTDLSRSPWSLVGVLSGACAGVAVTAIRAVRRRGPDGATPEGSWTVFAWFTLLGLLTTLPAVFGGDARWVAPALGEWALLLAVAGLSVVAQLILTRALTHVTAAGSGIVHQVTVVLSLAGGVLLFDEALVARAAVGCVLTVAGVVLAVLRGA
jgi:drug/metabolite transporter (DMT)-like permease